MFCNSCARGNLHEIHEYLEEQGVYDIFDYLLKDWHHGSAKEL